MFAVLLSAAAIVFLAGLPAQAPRCPSADSGLEQLLTDSTARLERDDNTVASACFALAIERASASGDQKAEARARLGLARASLAMAAYARGEEEAQRARALFDQQHDRLGVARAEATLGSAAAFAGRRKDATALYQDALRVFKELGAEADRASAVVSYTMAADLPAAEEFSLVDEAVAIARRLKLRAVEARALHSRADKAFSEGLFDVAIRDLSAAIDLFQAEGRQSSLADAYVSMGRIHRAHGQPEAAIGFYEQAAAIQEQIGDLRGLVQSTNAKAVALSAAGHIRESRAAYERALELARQTGSSRLINFQQGNLAASYGTAGDHAGAIRLLEDVIQRESDPYILAYRHMALASSYQAVGQPARAVEHANQGIKCAEQSNNRELLPGALLTRAQALRDLGRISEAVSDAQTSTRIIEEIRARLVPLDFMKRAFSQRNQESFGLTISLLHARGDHAASLVVSEQARARAFLDLLASRSLVRQAAAPAVFPRGVSHGADAPLASFAAASPASATDIAHIAARLQSTILAYWVERDELFIWVIPPGAPVQSARVQVARRELEQTVTASLPTPMGADLDALNRLYRWLIDPVARWLPQPGGVLTIIAHGPLFRVSFAALRNSRGRYLIEQYALGYSPSISAFMFTERLAERAQHLAPSYLLVADPSPLPPGSEATPLVSLPATLREARAIRRTLGASTSAIVLSGTRASEPLVKDAMHGRRIIHIATHASVNDDDPLESFLALGRAERTRGPAADGRLTVTELYDLDLESDLVILSACSTATGRLSGDGIAALSRALFYAGAASVMATQWNVADEPSARLMVLFYEKWRGTADKRRALQAAQLEMIRELGSGSLVVRTKLGTVRLREQPFNWAGYLLFGEP